MIKLWKRKSNAKLEYVPFNSNSSSHLYPEVGRIIVGKKMARKEGKWVLISPGFVGSHGALEMLSSSIPYSMWPKDLPRDTKCVEIIREIPKKHRGKGIGTSLLAEAERIAKKSGFEFIWAVTMNPIAVATYKKCGWNFLGGDETAAGHLLCYGKRL